jgi:hypothetical protein
VPPDDVVLASEWKIEREALPLPAAEVGNDVPTTPPTTSAAPITVPSTRFLAPADFTVVVMLDSSFSSKIRYLLTRSLLRSQRIRKRQEARGKRQEARGKRQEARGKRQEGRGKRRVT